jgi:hypothetical protein
MEDSHGRDNIGALDSQGNIVCGRESAIGVGYHYLDKIAFL